MKEIKGELWDFFDKQPGVTILITTNGSVRNDGYAVMGRGCALEAAQRFPVLASYLGALIKRGGNIPYALLDNLITFPVKHRWNEKADPTLIKLSAKILSTIAETFVERLFILPRPGCGNGGLTWEEVKPIISFLPNNVHIISREGE